MCYNDSFDTNFQMVTNKKDLKCKVVECNDCVNMWVNYFPIFKV